MKTIIEISEKKGYRSPKMERVTLDNEISLALSSPGAPPAWSKNQDNTKNDPFKTNVG